MSEGIPVFPKDPVLALIFGSLLFDFLHSDFLPVPRGHGTTSA